MTNPTAPELLSRIKEYLSLGGLFNPELMEHDKVQQLIMDCRIYIHKQHKQQKKLPSFLADSTFINH